MLPFNQFMLLLIYCLVDLPKYSFSWLTFKVSCATKLLKVSQLKNTLDFNLFILIINSYLLSLFYFYSINILMFHKSALLLLICIVGCAYGDDLPDFLGRGYNIMTGNPTSNSLDPGFRYNPFILKNSQQRKIDSTNYTYPDAATILKQPSCSFHYDMLSTHSM